MKWKTKLTLLLLFLFVTGCERYDHRTPIWNIDYEAPDWAIERNLAEQIDFIFGVFVRELYPNQVAKSKLPIPTPNIRIIINDYGRVSCPYTSTGYCGANYSTWHNRIRIYNVPYSNSVLWALAHELHHFFSYRLYGDVDADHLDLFADVSRARDIAQYEWDQKYPMPR